MRRLLFITMFLLMAAPALATVDLLEPANGLVTNSTSITFEYYVSLEGLTTCNINAGDQVFPDPDPEGNAMNEVVVQNIVPGTHTWNVTCSGNESETSSSRTFTVDVQQPTITITSPENGSTHTTIPVDFVPNDDQDQTLACTITWSDTVLDFVDVSTNTHFVNEYTGNPGEHTLSVSCEDDAGNTISEERIMTLNVELFLDISTNDDEYGIDDPVLFTINTLPETNLTVDICPNEQGFVQCTTALIDNDEFPQTITLPYLNKTGEYLIDVLAVHGEQTIVQQITYTLTNRMVLTFDKTAELLNETITLTTTVSGGAPPYSIVWELPNSTIRTGVSTIDVIYNDSGEYNISVTATDSVGNVAKRNLTVTIDPVYEIDFKIIDNETLVPINGAEIDLDGQEETTLVGGLASFEMDEGVHRVFVSAEGYEYFFDDIRINYSGTVTIGLVPNNGAPEVTVLYPAQNGTAGTPAIIRYVVSHTEPVTCTLLLATDNAWYVENGTAEISDNTEKEFVRPYSLGEHNVRIECVDEQERTGSSPIITFIVTEDVAEKAEIVEAIVEPTDDEVHLQQVLEDVTSIVEGLSGYDQNEKQAIEILEFDKNLRNLRRMIQQSIRDIDGLRFREDIDENGKRRERESIMENTRAAIARTPLYLEVLDAQTIVKYVKEDEMAEIAAELIGLEGMIDDEKKLTKLLNKDQQKFTSSTKLMQVRYIYDQDVKSVVTVISRSFTYADDVGEEYSIIEVIPKEVVKDANELLLVTDAEVLRADPVLRFPRVQEITYVIPKKVDFTKLETIKTLIVRPYADGGNAVGFVVFTGMDIDVFGLPLFLLIALIVLIYLAYYFDLLSQVRYLIYRFGKNEQVHYLRVLINDTEDHLEANNYEKAELLYKEIRMTYDTLSELAQNDLYEDIMRVVHMMDGYYFNMIMIELDHHLKAGDVEQAIVSYEKLTGTFDRLDTERQHQLVERVTAIARRIGVEVHA